MVPESVVAPMGDPLSWKGRVAGAVDVVLISAGHLMSDVYASYIVTLLPLWVHLFDLSFSAAGFLVFVRSASMALFQPVGGYVADRTTRQLFPVGLLVVALMMSSVGLAPSYSIVILLVLIATMGHSLFGPQAASEARRSSGSFRGLGLSIYLTGGWVGAASGPLIIASLVDKVGLQRSWLMLLPGLVLCILLFIKFAAPAPRPQKAGSSAGILAALCSGPTLALAAVLLLRGGADTGIVSFLPILVAQRGGSLITIGATVSVFKLAGATGAIVAGSLSDRLNWKPYMVLSLVLAPVLLYGALQSSGWLALVFVALLGAALLSSSVYTLDMAQSLLPDQMSTATGLTFSLMILGGGLVTWCEGLLADLWGVQAALLVIGVALPLSAAAATLGIRARVHAT